MEQIGERQRWVWAVCALSAVAAIALCGMGWLWVLAGGLAVGGYYYYIDNRLGRSGLAEHYGSMGLLGKVLAVLTLFWIVFVMGSCAAFASSAFPMVDGFPVLGWILLALAAWGSKKGAAACAGCCGILSLLLLALYGTLAVFSLPEAELAYLVPAGGWVDAVVAAGMMLLPTAVWCIGVKEKKKVSPVAALIPGGFAVLPAVTAGVLSPQLAQAAEVPLYELARSVSVLGVVERIEPLLSAAVTVGVFCLLSIQSCACRALAGQIGPWPWSGGFCCLVAGVVMVAVQGVSMEFLAVGNSLFFLLFPVAAAALKKVEKS